MQIRPVILSVTTTLLLGSILLSGCSDNKTPEPFKTPSAPASTGAGVVKGGSLLGNSGQGSNPPGVAMSGKAFGVDTSKVEVPDDAKAIWGDAANTAADDALSFWQVAMAIEPRWTSETPNADDYRAVEPLMTPESWNRLYAAAQQNPTQSIASDLVPGKTTDSTIVDVKIKAQTPMVLTPQDVHVSVAQDQQKFGDNDARMKVTAVIPFLVTAEDGTLVSLQDKVTIYMLPFGSGWVVDNWDAGSIQKA